MGRNDLIAMIGRYSFCIYTFSHNCIGLVRIHGLGIKGDDC